MSSRKVTASSAAMILVLILAGLYHTEASPLTASPAAMSAAGPGESPSLTPANHDPGNLVRGRASGNTGAGTGTQPPRDTRPGAPRPPTSREMQLHELTMAEPSAVANWLELARLQEARGARDEAERTFAAAARALHGQPGAREVLVAMTRFFQRTGQFDKAIAALEDLATQDPADPTGHQLVATFYWEKVQKDASLTGAEKLAYLQAGIAATDRALTYKPDYAEAMIYKNILLRMQANLETDPSRRQQLIAEADVLRARAIELQAAAGPTGASVGPQPPPPPSPPQGFDDVDGQTPVRIGGSIPPPTKITDVRPVYPEEAKDARVQGVVIIEAVLDTEGGVRDARVLRSIPMLDDAALDAVRQWRFAPTMLNGAPVPVVMTVTVNFTLQ